MEKSSKRDVIMDSLKGIKMRDAGEKPRERMKDTPCATSSGPYYPSLYLNTKQAPELSGSEVEDSVTLVLKCKITGHNLNESPRSTNENFDLKIKKIGIVKK